MNILIVDDEADIKEILTFILESEVVASFLYAGSGEEAIKVIQESPQVDLIICDYNMPNGNGGSVYKYLLDNSLAIPYAMCSSDYPEDHDVFEKRDYFIAHIVKPELIEGIQVTLEKYEKFKVENCGEKTASVQRNEELFSYISMGLISKIEVLPSDLFLKVNGKIMKIMNEGEKFTITDYEKYSSKGLAKLLVPKDKTLKYFDTIVKVIEHILLDLDPETINEVSNPEIRVIGAHAVIMETLSTLGISEGIVNAAEKSVEYAIKVFEKNKSFHQIEQNIFSSTENYLTKHSVVLAYIACGLMTKLPWDSAETRNKLTMASFLHDATIRDERINEANFNLDSDDYELVKTFKDHPKEAAALINKFKGIPPDTDRIILEHHERPDGTGFPRGLTARQISPLGSVFILAHQVADVIFDLSDKGLSIDQDSVIKGLNWEDYKNGSFKKAFQSLLQTKLFKDGE